MKLYNTIIVFDFFTVAQSEEEAIAAVLAAIRGEEPEKPTEFTAIEARNKRDVPEQKGKLSPFVANDISDEDFATLKGKTTEEIRQMIYAKSEPSK